MSKSTGAVNHIHKYFKNPATKHKLWHCAGIDGCTHYLPKNMPEPVGRPSICWHCEKPFQLMPNNMEENKPICESCAEKMEITNSFIEEKFREVGLDPSGRQTGLNAFKSPLAYLEAKAKENARKRLEAESISPSMKSITPSKPEHRDDCASLYSAGLKCDCKDEVDYE